MIWGKGSDKKDDEAVARLRDEPRPDFSKEPIPREKLPRKLQKLVDREDEYYDELYTP
jgi:fission process protein 1